MLAAISLRTWALIGTGAIIAALVIALLMTRTALAETKRERDVAEVKLSVSNGSVKRLEGEIARMVAEQKALANEDANRVNASRQTLQIIAAVENVRQAAIDRLNASASVMREPDTTGQCDVSETLKEQWPA